MDHRRFLRVLFYLSFLIFHQFKKGKSDDIPEFSCDTMTPENVSFDFQNSITPYTISTDNDCSTVIIQGNDFFKKFIIKAFDPYNHTIGKFVMNNNRTKIICEETAVSQSAFLNINQIGLRWDSNGYVGKVHFIATIMKDDLHYWRVSSASCEIIPTTNTAQTVSYPRQEEFEPQKSCPQNSRCFQCRDNNCVITWSNDDNIFVDFQVSGYVRSDNRYLAIAFFYNESMGNGSMVICQKEYIYYAQLWFGVASSTIVNENPLESLKLNGTTGSYKNNWMSCKFSKQIKRSSGSSNKVFYLDESLYNLFFATGLMSKNREILHERKSFSTEKFNFTDFSINSITAADLTYQESCPGNAGCFVCSGENCVITWSPGKNNYLNFQVSATVIGENSYVALGLSFDENMGDDSIMLCYKKGGSYDVSMWHSSGHSIQPVSNPLESLDFTEFKGFYSNGRMSCQFSRQIMRPEKSDKLVYYLNESPYYLLFASGSMKEDIPVKHAYRTNSESVINFTDISAMAFGEVDFSKNLIKAHGILMTVAWLMLASFTILMPRYFKSAWPDTKILEKPLWFIGHQTLMVLVFLLTSIAFIVIFCEVEGYVQDEASVTRAHAPIGIITMILVFINPVMALGRCNPEHNYRWVFNYFHTVVGELALILSVINIFLSFYIPRANIGHWVKWVMVALICWHVLIELLLILHEKYLHSSRQLNEIRSARELKLSTFLLASDNTSSKIKTVLILSQWIGVTGLAIVVCVGIGVA